MRCNDVLCTLWVWISENTQYCYCQPFTFPTHFSVCPPWLSRRWITNISPLFPDKYFPMMMMCCVGMTRISGRRTDDCGDLSVLSVLDKYTVSLSLSHHPNIIITGWYRDTIDLIKQCKQNNIFSVKLFCLFVWLFCTSVIGMQGTLWSVQQTIIYLRFNPVSDLEQDMRSSDQDLVNPQSSWWPEHFPRAPGLTPSHRPVPDMRLPTAKCLDANLL